MSCNKIVGTYTRRVDEGDYGYETHSLPVPNACKPLGVSLKCRNVSFL